MLDNTSNNKRIAKNSVFLYFRMVIIMVVTLFTSRVILQSLGVQDFGIYNVVGGIITMFQFLNGALSDSSQRYITFELGKKEKGNVNEIFSLCINLHYILGFIVVLVAEPIGVWFIYNKLMIPEARLNAAFWVYQFTIISMFVMFVSIPYNAMIIAHEKMSAFAMISIVDAFLRLIVAYSISISMRYDKLIIYSFLMLLTQVILRSVYTIYCKKNFKESKYHFYWNRDKIREMGGFASWTIMGNISHICTTQGLNLLLGTFFCPAVNAARGIAVQVQGSLSTFARNFQTAVNPQITKSYASSDITAVQQLVFMSSRFSFFLLILPLIPIMVEAPIILSIWLKTVPDNSVIFTRLVILISLIGALQNPVSISIKATGNLKRFQICVFGIKLLILPIAYIMLKLGSEAYLVFLIQVIMEFIAVLNGARIACYQIGLSFKLYIHDVIFKSFVVGILSLALPLLIHFNMEEGVIRLIVIAGSSVFSTGIIIYFLGLSKNEKYKLVEFVKQKTRR